MSITFTSDALVDRVKRVILAPTSQVMFTSAQIVDFLTDIMQMRIVPAIKKVNGEYFVAVADTAMSSSITSYDIPKRATGGALRDICLVDSNGNEGPVPVISPADRKMAVGSAMYGAYMEDNKVVFLPSTPPTGMSLRLRYERRPNNLVLTSQAMVITAIDTGLKQVTVSSVPTGLYPVLSVVDFIQAQPYFKSLQDDAVITVVAGSVFTFASLPTGLAVGDYVSLSSTSPVPQLPYEAHMVMAEYAGAKILKSMGDEQAENVKGEADELLAQLITSITPRISGTVKRVKNPRGIFESPSIGGIW